VHGPDEWFEIEWWTENSEGTETRKRLELRDAQPQLAQIFRAACNNPRLRDVVLYHCTRRPIAASEGHYRQLGAGEVDEAINPS